MTQNFLTDIVTKTQARIDQLPSLGELEKKQPPELQHSFYQAVAKAGLSLIAEVKAASPSKGVIRQHFEPLAIAEDFQQKGARAVSVLTEPDYFLGKLDYLEKISQSIDLPTIRKDFILDKRQILEAKQVGASAVLLIAAILEKKDLAALFDYTHSLGMDALIEIHHINELEKLNGLNGVKLIGVNNRDLQTFKTDTQQIFNCLPEIKKQFPEAKVIAESGYQDAEALDALEAAGIDAVLIGEGLAVNQSLIDFFQKQIDHEN